MAEQAKHRTRPQGRAGLGSIRIKARPDDLSISPTGRPEEDDGGQELKGVYIISVASRLLDMHPQTLRKYERLGLVSPSRTIGMLRLYSEEDIEKLRLIKYLEENLGLNLAGVEFTLNLLNHLLEMQHRLRQMAEAERFFGEIEREMTRLFRNLNLPRQE